MLYWWPVSDQDAGVEWYRVELPLREYSRRGGRCSRQRSDVLSPEIAFEADVIIGGYRGINPRYRNVWIKLCELAENRMIFDIDDDFFSAPDHFRTSNPLFLGMLEEMIRESHVVTVTTPVLADRLLPLNSNVHVVPNRVPSWLTEWNRPQASELTVGWAGGESHEWDWADVAPYLGRFLTRQPDVSFNAIGYWDWGNAAVDLSSWPSARVRRSGWFSNVEEYYKSIDFDIGVIPLAAEEFNRSKSAIKALEYAALGVPAVASAYGPYPDFVRDGETGYLVKHGQDWQRFLSRLVRDPELRVEMGEAARRLAREHTIEGNLESWLTAWIA